MRSFIRQHVYKIISDNTTLRVKFMTEWSSSLNYMKYTKIHLNQTRAVTSSHAPLPAVLSLTYNIDVKAADLQMLKMKNKLTVGCC